MASLTRVILPLAAVALVGGWLWHRHAGAPVREPADATVEMPVTASPSTPAVPRVQPPLQVPGPPRIENPTPEQIAQLRQAEAAHSQASAPVATYTGPDGRQHAFRYQATPQQEVREREREDREAALMRELEADPAAFARKYHLSAREVERMLDGSLPLPAEMP